MAWPIVEVARMARTTPSTLRYHHAAGLLEPAWIGANGYRYYEREQSLRPKRTSREQRHLERLQRTLAHIERGAPMPAENYFDAFGEEQQAYEQELIDRLGDDVKPAHRPVATQTLRLAESRLRLRQGRLARGAESPRQLPPRRHGDPRRYRHDSLVRPGGVAIL